MSGHNDVRTFHERWHDFRHSHRYREQREVLKTLGFITGFVVFVIILIVAIVAIPDDALGKLIWKSTETEVICQIKTTAQGLYVFNNQFNIGCNLTDGTSEAFRIYSTSAIPVESHKLFQSFIPGQWYKLSVWGTATKDTVRAVYKAERIENPLITPSPTKE